MAGGVVVSIITYKDGGGLILGFKWEIVTNGAIIISKKKIDSKNHTFISLKRHLAKFLQMRVTRGNVKNREVIEDET